MIVLGASGDLAKKKTYPSLFALFVQGLFPRHAVICGFARSPKTDQAFRDGIRPGLKHDDPAVVESFLERCYYRAGSYGSQESFAALSSELTMWEARQDVGKTANRLYYFAIPPNVFLESGIAIKVSLASFASPCLFVFAVCLPAQYMYSERLTILPVASSVTPDPSL